MIIRKIERKTYFHGHGQHLVQLWLIYWWLSVIQNNTYYIEREREVRLSVKMRWNHNDENVAPLENWPWKFKTHTSIIFSWNIYIPTYIEWHCLYNNLILTLLHILNKNKNDTSLFWNKRFVIMKCSRKKFCSIFCIRKGKTHQSSFFFKKSDGL